MGNILYTKQNEKGPINFFCGNVSRLRSPNAPGKPYDVTVQLNLLNPDSGKWEVKPVSFAGWNNEKRPFADQLGRMKLRVGAYVFGVCGDLSESKTQRGTFIDAPLFSLSYSGIQTIEDNSKSYLLLCGRIGNVTMKEDHANFTLAIDAYCKEDGRTTKWYNINAEDAVFQRLKKGGRLSKGAKMSVLGQLKETKKETKNPVVNCIRFDFSMPSKDEEKK